MCEELFCITFLIRPIEENQQRKYLFFVLQKQEITNRSFIQNKSIKKSKEKTLRKMFFFNNSEDFLPAWSNLHEKQAN